ncbi:hypothetical protein J2128_001063 [Methanomicrobium sp. W14]|uniref:hypothetical protein n=1 Tax=Methanomicrobium sp. W14 TaxID=2817839 RepID=UPI001AE17D81|nr:hypothetical protein [Methanomicrobium sp. W14]MBP2133142.1 hypothetical protein [Methanomicrobium sp. W14]
MRTETEEAVSTVVAIMLILAIFATCMAVYTSTYVPGLKQQSEILHNKDVKYSFLRFSSDVDNIYSLGRVSQFSEPLVLGGGSILLSASESGGRIDMKNTKIGELSIYEDNTEVRKIPIETVSVIYTPYFSSWELQGYRYENGTVWITKDGIDKKAPASVSLNSVSDGKDNEKNNILNYLSGMAESYTSCNETKNIRVISMKPGEPDYISGSGSVALNLNCQNSSISHVFSKNGRIVLSSEDGYEKTISASAGDTLTIDILETGVSVK